MLFTKNKIIVILLIFITLSSSFIIRAQEKIDPYVITGNTIVARNQNISNGSITIKIPLPQNENTGVAINPIYGGFSTSCECIYSLSISGVLTFRSKDGIFKAVAHTEDGEELLIYRDLGRFHTVGEPITLSQAAFETALYTSRIKQIEIIANGCIFKMDEVIKATQNHTLRTTTEELRKKMHSARLREAYSMINRINQYNKKRKIPWRAGLTQFSLRSYKDKKAFWNVSSLADEKTTYGWEYYKGGILTPSDYDLYQYLDFIDEGTGKYVASFNWANQHGKNWNTPCENQMWEETALPENKNSYSCWTQGPKALLESYIKRYTGNCNRNERLSSQQIISCSGGIAGDSTSGGSVYKAINYICNSGVISWNDMPFKYIHYPCEEMPKKPHKRFIPEKQINYLGTSVENENPIKSRDALMKALIQHGPIALTHIKGQGGHAMLLSGWLVVKPGPFLPSWEEQPVEIEKHHPLVGKVAWIFKNSVGDDWGYNGYAYLVRNNKKSGYTFNPERLPLVSFTDPYILTGSLKYFEDGKEKALENICVDEDNDGYYRWGLIGRPNNPDIPIKMDGDDSNPALGPMDEYGFCKKLKDVDLYMKDTPYDKGVEPNESGRDMWESSDIWIRNEPNSTSEEHENPESGKKAYVHVRIHNKGTRPSEPGARVAIYWAKAGIYLTYDTFNGKEKLHDPKTNESYPAGGFIKSVAIPSIPAGGHTIVTIPWDLPDYEKYKNLTEAPWHYCLLARIVAPTEEYYYTDTQNLGSYVSCNNNVIQKNITIIETMQTAPLLNNKGSFIEGAVSIHNPTSKVSNLRIELVDGDSNAPISHEAEVSFKFNSTLQKACLNAPIEGLRIMANEARLVATAPISKISNIRLAPGETGLLQVKFNFLTQKMTEKELYTYKVRLINQETGKVIGGETYVIRKSPRTPFVATIIDDQNGRLRAHEIGEPASYKWIDAKGKVVSEGKEVEIKNLSSHSSKEITLEVEAKLDGFKDYTKKEKISPIGETQLILAPIPAQNYLEIHYPAESIEYLQIVITDMSQGYQKTQSITGGWNSYRLDISSLPTGNYTLMLRQESNVIATRNFTKQ